MSDRSRDQKVIKHISSTLNRVRGTPKTRDDGTFSTASRISYDLSKINYLKTSSVLGTDFEGESQYSFPSRSDDASHALYDRVADKFYGVPNFNKDIHWTNVYLAGCWGSRAYEYSGWDDAERYTVRSRRYQDLDLTEDEENGILSQRVIAVCSSYLDRSPETEQYVLCKCVLSDKGFYDISALKKYHYLQYLDISKNRVDNLHALSELPFLMYLDASYNLLTEVLDFKAPFNLTHVNLSSNDIKAIRDLTAFWSLIVLDLSHNEIEVISGLQNLEYLRELNLSYNWICKVEGLNNLDRMQCLNLYNNIITKFEIGPDVGFKTMMRLKKVSLARNLLTSLQVIEQARSLQMLDLSDNRIDAIIELVYLQDLTNLYDLDLRDNVVRYNLRYFDTCINYCKNVFVLDGEEVTAETKVLSRKKFGATIFQYIKPGPQHMLLQNINFPNISKSVIPYNFPPRPMIVLVGPPSCMKGFLVDLCCEMYPQYVSRGVNHTTRPRSEGEIDGEQYHFVSYDVFKDMMRKGLFYTTSEYFGHLYGFALSEVCKDQPKKYVLMIHSDLNGALLLRARGLRPTLVLTIPKSEEVHRKYLRRKYYCHSLTKGILEVGISETKAYEGLRRIKKYNHRKVVSAMKKLLVDIFKDTNQENATKTIENIDLPIAGGLSIRKLLGELGISRNDETKQNKDDLKDILFMANDQMEHKIFYLQGLDVKQREALKKLGIDKIIESFLLKEENKEDTDPDNEESAGIIMQEVTNLEKLFDDILASRKTYLEMHWANPGLFTQVLFTDDMEQGLDTLTQVLKNCVRTHHLRSPICQMEHHPKNHPLVQKRLQVFRNMMSPEGIVANEKRNCPPDHLGFQNVEGKSYYLYD
ncbi:hypothetical protein HHI36_015254 [Cryptolaemus montrouzieri]|uniref:Dynein axonemal assembly factor 1 homolog n=1 Tax=Cryptolaemus montrouzieri TaxID=559131 RepID=A0ABD2N539_9CUCU